MVSPDFPDFPGLFEVWTFREVLDKRFESVHVGLYGL